MYICICSFIAVSITQATNAASSDINGILDGIAVTDGTNSISSNIIQNVPVLATSVSAASLCSESG